MVERAVGAREKSEASAVGFAGPWGRAFWRWSLVSRDSLAGWRGIKCGANAARMEPQTSLQLHYPLRRPTDTRTRTNHAACALASRLQRAGQTVPRA